MSVCLSVLVSLPLSLSWRLEQFSRQWLIDTASTPQSSDSVPVPSFYESPMFILKRSIESQLYWIADPKMQQQYIQHRLNRLEEEYSETGIYKGSNEYQIRLWLLCILQQLSNIAAHDHDDDDVVAIAADDPTSPPAAPLTPTLAHVTMVLTMEISVLVLGKGLLLV